MSRRPRSGCYPGSFNPPTIAHLAIAEAARDQCQLDRVDLVVSRVALAKEDVEHPPFDERIAILERVAATRPWLGVVVTEAQLLADVAAGYDVLVLGADKWVQIQDVVFYDGSEEARDAALARLPEVALVRRPPHELPPGLLVLDVPAELGEVSSTLARAGRSEFILPEGRAPGGPAPSAPA